jgi:3'-5' exoribonuclease
MYSKKDMTPLQNLRALAKKKLGIQARLLADQVLCDSRLPHWSGSAKPEHHHHGEGGLVRHVWEVVNLCFINQAALGITTINDEELFLAALYHDVGKFHDYAKVDGVWTDTEHKRLIHHISRSGIIWSNMFEKLPNINKGLHDPVLHAILAHHGQRAWGSPVAPKSQVAWLLHLCDSISARMDDWNKMDLVKYDPR